MLRKSNRNYRGQLITKVWIHSCALRRIQGSTQNLHLHHSTLEICPRFFLFIKNSLFDPQGMYFSTSLGPSTQMFCLCTSVLTSYPGLLTKILLISYCVWAYCFYQHTWSCYRVQCIIRCAHPVQKHKVVRNEDILRISDKQIIILITDG